MRFFCLWILLTLPLFAAVGFQTPTTRPETQTSRWQHTVPFQVGDVLTSRSRVHWRLTSHLSHGSEIVGNFDEHQEEASEKQVTILNVDGPRVRRVRVTYSVRTSFRKSAEEPEQKISPLQGRTFEVEETPDGLSVSEPGAGRVSAEVAALVLRDLVSKGRLLWSREDRLVELMAGRSLQPGFEVSVPTDLVEELFVAGLGDVQKETSSLHLRNAGTRVIEGREARVIECRGEVRARGESGEQFRQVIDGEVLVDAETRRFLAMNLAGPIEVRAELRGEMAAFVMEGQGQGRMQRQVEYRKVSPR